MRYLVCLDAVPAADGSCAQAAYVEQASLSDYLPTVEEAHTVGFAFLVGLVTVAAFANLTKPRRAE